MQRPAVRQQGQALALGWNSCLVRVGRALYTAAFLHSYVQWPLCRHRWQTTPALPSPTAGACAARARAPPSETHAAVCARSG